MDDDDGIVVARDQQAGFAMLGEDRAAGTATARVRKL
jgi:hypothetical protein